MKTFFYFKKETLCVKSINKCIYEYICATSEKYCIVEGTVDKIKSVKLIIL